MKKTIINIITGVGAIILVYGARQFYLLYNAVAKVYGVKINSISTRSINIDLGIEIDNKSDISAIITEQNYIVYFNKVEVSKINSSGVVKFHSNGKTTFTINVLFSPDKFFSSNILSLIANIKNAELEIKGKLSLTAGALSLKKYPIDIKYTVADLIKISKS